MKGAGPSGSKIQVLLNAGDGSHLPAQISIRPLAKDGFKRATIGMVVTDLKEARRTEESLRALAHRVVQVQKEERGRVAPVTQWKVYNLPRTDAAKHLAAEARLRLQLGLYRDWSIRHPEPESGLHCNPADLFQLQ